MDAAALLDLIAGGETLGVEFKGESRRTLNDNDLVDVLAEYVDDVRLSYQPGQQTMLWPTERGGRLSVGYMNTRFREYADAPRAASRDSPRPERTGSPRTWPPVVG